MGKVEGSSPSEASAAEWSERGRAPEQERGPFLSGFCWSLRLDSGMPDSDAPVLPPRPAPSPAEVASRSNRGGFKAAVLAEWGVAWPPPEGWRRELERRHRLGLEVQPIPVRTKREKASAGPEPGAPDLSVGSRELDQPILVSDFGEVDPADPPPWL